MKAHWAAMVFFIGLICISGVNCGTPEEKSDVLSRLKQWRQGVWISGEGTYMVYTDTHYFVVSYEGDSTSPNIYVGASQVLFHAKGTARSQTIRIRQNPGSTANPGRWTQFVDSHQEILPAFDTTQFKSGTCNIVDGIIYDAVTEVTDTSIIMATCNGDTEIIYYNGVSAYRPAGGGEYLSYRVEEFSGK